VVFGNGNSRIALVKEDSVAVINLREKLVITGLEAEKDIIWAGTDKGLIWGGVKGVAEGKPWPINRSYFGWSGTLFGSRDTRGMEYRWKTVGYNTAMVVGLQRIGTDTWAAYSSKTGSNKASGGIDQSSPKGKSGGMDDLDTGPVTDVRRYVFIDEFIARKQKMQYESYGTGTGIRSEPSALYVSRENGTLWIGTMDGLWELENN
jgi:ligand-binding sensor domain-containing protein